MIWMSVKARVPIINGDGTTKNVVKTYVINALSISEAEANITEELQPYYQEFEIRDIHQTDYSEIFFSDNGDTWYKLKVAFILFDEKSGKEKKTCVNYLVQANSLDEALRNTKEQLSDSMSDYRFVSATETCVCDVFKCE